MSATEDETILNREERKHVETLQRLLDEEAEPGPERAALAWAIKALHEHDTAVRVARIETQIRKLNGRLGTVETQVADLIDQDEEA